MTTQALSDALSQAALIQQPLLLPEHTDHESSPWFLQAVIGLCAWVAGLFLLYFLYMLLEEMLKSRGQGFLLIGAITAATAVLLLRIHKPAALFLPQFALALAFGAQVSFGLGLAEFRQSQQILYVGMIAFEAPLFFLFNNSIQRFISVVAAAFFWGLSLRLALIEGILSGVQPTPTPQALLNMAWLLFTWVLIFAPLVWTAHWLLRNESRWTPSQHSLQITALTQGLIAALCIAPLSQLPSEYGNTAAGFSRLALWSCFAALLSLIALALAFYRQDRPLLGLTILAALLEISCFYYALGVSLLFKATLMALLGVAFLLTAYYLHQYVQRRNPA